MATRKEWEQAYIDSINAGDEERAQRIAEGLGYTPEVPQVEVQSEDTDTVEENVLDVLGEGAAAANRTVMDTLDFLGPGSINAALRLAGIESQLPTFAGAFSNTPGAEGGFMEPGLARDAVRGAGAVLPAAGSLAPVAGRNLASLGGASAELLGLGSANPVPTAAAVGDSIDTLLLQGRGGRPSAMAQRADEIGFPISPGERYDNYALRKIESGIESTPMPFNPMVRQGMKRQEMMNRAAARSVGLDPRTRLTDDVVGDVAEELSDEFNRLGDLDRIGGNTEGFVDELVGIQDASRSRIFRDPDIEATINKVFDRLDAEGQLAVDDYQDITSELKAKARQAWKGESPDPYFAETLGEIIDVMDNLATDSVSPADMARLRDARTRWRALSQLEKSGALRESGDVSGPILGNYLRRTDKAGYGRGGNRSDLYETARLSKAYPSRPDSGTAERQFFNQLFRDPVAGAAGLMLGPVTSTAANAYYYGRPLTRGAADKFVMSPGLTARFGAMLEDDEEEANVPYLYD